MFHVPLPPHLTQQQQQQRRSSASSPFEAESNLIAATTNVNNVSTKNGNDNNSNIMVSASSESKYPSLSGVSLESLTPSAPPMEQSAEDDQKDVPTDLKKMGIRFKKVPVKATDSVMSIAVRNGISDTELRRFNRKLMFDYCDFVDFVWIPINPNMAINQTPVNIGDDDKNKKYFTMKQFCASTGSTEIEAQFYLDENNYDLKVAMKKYKDDLQWEEQHVQKKAASVAASNKVENKPLIPATSSSASLVSNASSVNSTPTAPSSNLLTSCCGTHE